MSYLKRLSFKFIKILNLKKENDNSPRFSFFFFYLNATYSASLIKQYCVFLNTVKPTQLKKFNENLTKLWTYKTDESLGTVLKGLITEN